MRNESLACVCVVSVLACCGVRAEALAINDSTGCRAAVDAFDKSEPGTVLNVATYIKNVMLAEERRTGSHVISRQSADGQTKSIAVAMIYCRDNPSSTVRKAATEAFEGFRALSQELGQE